MKELTTIEKAKRYDEAIKYGQYLINECCKESTDGSFHRADLQKMFPELAESEDERIRKHLIGVVELYYGNTDEQEKKDCLDWLERQGECHISHDDEIRTTGYWNVQDIEQKPVDKVEPKFKAGDKVISTISNIPYYITKVCNGHYLTDVGCVIMFNAQNNFELIEQKPTEWSEDVDLYTIANNFMPEPSWNAIIENNEEGSGAFAYDYIQMVNMFKAGVNWLKSLRPWSQWKPSDEQMNALKHASNDCSIAFADMKILATLYEQLKALHRYEQDT